MQIVSHPSSAEIIPFTGLKTQNNRLTMADRIQALQWSDPEASGASLRIHARQPADSPEIGDYVGIYRADDRWTAWGAARDGAVITVWHGPSGHDLGSFPSMKEALAAVTCAARQPTLRPTRRRRC